MTTTITIILSIFAAALLFGGISTPMVRKFALKTGFIAIPKADRAHTEPTALMGGVAIFTAAIISLLVIVTLITFFAGNILGIREFVFIVGSASLMALVGLWDDQRPMSATLKLGGQVLPAIIIFIGGVQIQWPFFDQSWLNTLFNLGLTIFWVLLATNAFNYMDNADGVAIMTSAVTSTIFLLIAVLNDQQLVSILAAAILGASLSFARYNLPLPRAQIFMGDSGSLFLGFLLAVLAIKIRIPTNVVAVTWMVPVIVLGLPIFDTFLVLVSRTRRGISFFQGGIDHTTHRLSRLGMDRLSVAFGVGLINGALGLVAIFITQANRLEAYMVAGGLGTLALYVLWRLELKPSYSFRTGKPEPERV